MHSKRILSLVKDSEVLPKTPSAQISRPTVPAPLPPNRTEPSIRPRTLREQGREPPIIEKKSMDKFIQLASCNSASLHNLDQSVQNEMPLSKSIGQMQSEANSNNESQSESGSCYNQQSSSIQVPAQKVVQKPALSAAPNPAQTVIQKPASSMIQTPTQTMVQSQPAVQVQSVSRSVSAKRGERDFEAAILLASSNAAANEFRIPSSRNFCGRLLSNKLSSSTSSTYDNSSESSISSSSAVLNGHPNPTKFSSDGSDESDLNSEYDQQLGMSSYLFSFYGIYYCPCLI